LTPRLRGIVPNFDAAVVADIIAARSKWRALPEKSDERKRMQTAYLRGDYQACLKAR
jgi:hypothetical protein